MTPLYLATIAGLPVGLFHDPGPTLAAKYPCSLAYPTHGFTADDVRKAKEAIATIHADYNKAVFMLLTDEEECDNTLSFTADDECGGRFVEDAKGRTYWIPEGYST